MNKGLPGIIFLIDSPSMVTLPLTKPARRATACSLGLNEPVAMGVGAPCTHALSAILGIGVCDKKLDLVTLPRTGNKEQNEKYFSCFYNHQPLLQEKQTFNFVESLCVSQLSLID